MLKFLHLFVFPDLHGPLLVKLQKEVRTQKALTLTAAVSVIIVN